MDSFTEMVDTAQTFFAELAAANTRDWFEPRKAHYVSAIRKPSELFAEVVSDELSSLTGVRHDAKLFRIYRDVRFSKDKTPYNCWIHILWSTRDGSLPAFFFSCAPEQLRLMHGVAGLKGASLDAYRATVDTRGSEIEDAMAAFGGALSDFGSDPLKRVPKPYAADHPHAELLKRKSLVVAGDIDATWRDIGLVSAVRARAAQALPLRGILLDITA